MSSLPGALVASIDSRAHRRAGSLVAMSKQQTREIMELAAVFVMLGGLLGFVDEQGFGRDTVIGAVGGGLLFDLILVGGALFGLIGRKP
jgi:hypothetical protein